MSWSKIKDAVGKYAPVAGMLLGGPAGGAVGGLISSALGVGNDPDAVATALMDPQKVGELRKWAMEHEQELQRLALQTLQTELADTQHARSTHAASVMPAVVTALLTLICGSMLSMLLFFEIPVANRDILIQSFGTVLGFWGASIAYWVGTTRSSSDKTRLMAGK